MQLTIIFYSLNYILMEPVELHLKFNGFKVTYVIALNL